MYEPRRVNPELHVGKRIAPLVELLQFETPWATSGQEAQIKPTWVMVGGWTYVCK